MPVFICGFPHTTGGAGGECWHSVRLWRRYGTDVTFIPTWSIADEEWAIRAEIEGTPVLLIQDRHQLNSIPGLPGSTVVAFCNDRATACFYDLRDLGCRIIYCPLMCSVRASEVAGYRAAFPDKIVFQSKYQRSKLEPQLRAYGYTDDRGVLIRGGISHWDMQFRPRPRVPDQPFVIGRQARSSPTKWHKRLWNIYSRVPGCRAIVQGIGPVTKAHLGPAPSWVQTLAPDSIPQEQFYRLLHAYVTMNDTVDENWPAVGREAMAYGVPVVAEDAFGWKEMIIHGETGFLGKTPEEIGDLAAQLAINEPLRLKIASQARDHLEHMLAPEVLWEQWRQIL